MIRLARPGRTCPSREATSSLGLPRWVLAFQSRAKRCDHRVTRPSDHERLQAKMTHNEDVQTAQSVTRSDDLQSAVAAATERFRATNPKSLAQHSAATAVMPGGNTRTVLYHDPRSEERRVGKEG